MSKKIACAHPGKHGDAIYALPAIRALCQARGVQADFYTSEYCAPLKELFEAQDCIDHFYVAPNYVIERMDMGAQPAYVPIDQSCYEATFQLGYRGTPDKPLPEFIGQSVGVVPAPISYQVPDLPEGWMGEQRDYLVLAPRGKSSYLPLFQEVVFRTSLAVVIVGGSGDGANFSGENVWNATDQNYLRTASIIKGAKAFVGLISSQLCLANGFPIPRICPHDGHSWDSRHWIRSEWNHYLVNPSADDVLRLIPGEN